MDALPRPLAILRELGNQPAAPYFEANVIRTVALTLDAAGIPYERDAYGNIIAHITRPGSDGDTPRPTALVAHMDHPGFEIASVHERTATAHMLGRTSDAVFEQRVPVIIHGANGSETRAVTTGRDSRPPERLVMLDLPAGDPPALPAYAVFDLPGFELDDDRVHMRACDDLAGCAATLAALEQITGEDGPTNVYGVFTRAEEEGLIGARLLAAERRLPTDTLVVSVESSRTLPGAEHGKGPVIRVGDAAATFSQRAEEVLLVARQRLAERTPPVPVQRQLMSGGVCEATAFLLAGYEATGVAFPLGHYHNGLAEDEVRAEFIHVSDFLGGVALVTEAVRAAAQPDSAPPVYQRLRATPTTEADRLRQTR